MGGLFPRAPGVVFLVCVCVCVPPYPPPFVRSAPSNTRYALPPKKNMERERKKMEMDGKVRVFLPARPLLLERERMSFFFSSKTRRERGMEEEKNRGAGVCVCEL